MKYHLAIALIALMCSACNEQEPAQAAAEAIATAQPVVEKTKVDAPAQSPFTIDYIMGKFDPTTHPDFTPITPPFADEKGMYLRKDTYESFKKMQAAAKADGISLVIKSATRPFAHQKRIWEGKWNGGRLVGGKDLSKTIPFGKDRALKILEYSSMPGTSRHHWGTDIDMNDFENEYFESGQGLKEYEWLVANGPTYGFCQVYTYKDEKRPEGYNLEKWHWSYLPISQQLTELAKTALTDEMISGFDGADAAKEIGVVSKYVLGINKECL